MPKLQICLDWIAKLTILLKLSSEKFASKTSKPFATYRVVQTVEKKRNEYLRSINDMTKSGKKQEAAIYFKTSQFFSAAVIFSKNV